MWVTFCHFVNQELFGDQCNDQSSESRQLFQLGKSAVEYQNQAKRLFRTLSATSPVKCSIESGQYLFQ